jgi:hypothetical protein
MVRHNAIAEQLYFLLGTAVVQFTKDQFANIMVGKIGPFSSSAYRDEENMIT